MKTTIAGVCCATFFLLGIAPMADAALVSRLGGQAVYDTDLDITWLADANLAKTNSFGLPSGILANGQMDWDTANQWIGAMNAAGYLGSSAWRLPTTTQPDFTCSTQDSGFGLGFWCSGSEFGHLFYTEMSGTTGMTAPPGTAPIGNVPAFQLFSNIERLSFPSAYWTGTSLNASFKWIFDWGNAEQKLLTKSSLIYVWPVMNGDVGAGSVPVPGAAWLFVSSLLLLPGIARRRR
ncbi:MAG: DUF1566 domain-containing protein [Gammaproteobacteria bacterium]